METREKIIVGVGIILFVGVFYYAVAWEKNHPCIQSHKELQYQQPLGLVVGGSKYGGGISVPMGNIKPVEVEVCDLR